MDVTNESDANEMLKAADGALEEMEAILSKMSKLAVMAAGENVSDKDRAFLQKEMADLLKELERVGDCAEYKGRKLLDGSMPGVFIPSGWDKCVHYTDQG